jgi:CTP synthase
LSDWEELVSRVTCTKDKKIVLTIAGKYLSKNAGDYELVDVYDSLVESIKHASWQVGVEVEIRFISTERIEKEGESLLEGSDAIVVPIGWGKRGVEGKITAIKYARERKVPYLGLCYGMQLACVEFARNVCGLEDVHAEECKSDAAHKIIHSIEFDSSVQTIKGEGTSMRLGAFDSHLLAGSLAYEVYSKHNAFVLDESGKVREGVISERHRHRYEFNNSYREMLKEKGFVFSGVSPDNEFVEMIELPRSEHPFFIATQAHPEYKSKPLSAHPLFIELLLAGLSEKEK